MSDPFAALGIEPGYDLDLVALEQRHRELSRALHPDRHSAGSPSARREALGRAIVVNQAWRTLRDPVERAEALLRRLGIGVGEMAEPAASPSLLMDMMEQREALATARQERNLVKVRELAAGMTERARGLTGELGRAFQALLENTERGSIPADQVTGLLQKLGELRYTRRFLEEASSIEDDLL